eukprot:749404-Hanusia_phi.AAC.3
MEEWRRGGGGQGIESSVEAIGLQSMAVDIPAKLQDFDRLPATAESKAALLAVAPLPKLLELLNDSNHVELVSKCLNKLFSESSREDLDTLKQQGSDLFPLGLQHPSEVVRKSTIKLVEKLMGEEADLLWLQERDLIFQLVRMLADDSIQMSTAASSVLLKAIGQKTGVSLVFNDRHAAHMNSIIRDRNRAVVAFRVLEFICTAWRRREEEAETFRLTGAKDELIAILHSDDVLLQLNAVEVIALLPPHEIGKASSMSLRSPLLTCSTGTPRSPPRSCREQSGQWCSAVETAGGMREVPGRLKRSSWDVESSADLERRFCEIVSEKARGDKVRVEQNIDFLDDGVCKKSSLQEQVDMLNILSVLSSTPRGLKIFVKSKTLSSVCRTVVSNLGVSRASSVSPPHYPAESEGGTEARDAVAVCRGNQVQHDGERDLVLVDVEADLRSFLTTKEKQRRQHLQRVWEMSWNL